MRWYGVAVKSPRSCGYNRTKQMGCGVPQRQLDVNGRETEFYLTTNTLRRPGSRSDSKVQADYADASTVPFIVLPGDTPLPGGRTARPGDYAAVVANNRIVFAVVGDSGPQTSLGEGSRSLLAALNLSSIDSPTGAYTALMPGTSSLDMTPWPITAAAITMTGMKKLRAALGAATDAAALMTLKACAGVKLGQVGAAALGATQ
jgi:hypothetical protein